MSAAVRRSFRSSFASLQVRNYRLYFGGQIVSLAGNWMQIVAELWLILTLTDSGLAVGIATALQFTGILLFGALGGSLADRFDKRKLLMVTQTGMAVPAMLLFILAVSGSAQAWMVFVVIGLRGPRPRRRQPRPAGVRDRARRPRPGPQRGQPEQRPRPLGADHRPGDRRRDHRALRRGALFRRQLAQLRGDALRPLQDAPGQAPPAPPRSPPRQRPRGAPARRRSQRAAGAAGADAGAEHGRLQLPGGAPAARRAQLRRPGLLLLAADGRDGDRIDPRRPHRRDQEAGQP